MGVVTKTSAKAYFETGDKPTQSQFADLIDSYLDHDDTVHAVASAAQGGKTGLLEVLATADVTVRTAGSIGLAVLNANTTASASNVFGITSDGVVGAELRGAGTTVSATGHLGVGAVGSAVFTAGTTASATGHLGLAAVGAVGSAVYTAGTSASALGHMGGDKGALTGFIETPAAKTYTLDHRAAFPYTVDTIRIALVSGSCDAQFQIDGVDIADLAAVRVTAAHAVFAASAPNTVAASSLFTMILSTVVGAGDMSFTILTTKH